MRPQSARRLVWCAWALSVTLLAAAHASWALLDDTAGSSDITLSFLLIVTALALTYSTVGGIVAARRPANPVGWIFLGGALSAALILAAAAYAEAGVPVPASGPLPASDLAAWVSEAFAFPTVLLISLCCLSTPMDAFRRVAGVLPPGSPLQPWSRAQ